MDPLSVVASLLTIVALSQSALKIASSLAAAFKSYDPRVDQIYYRLLAEKKRTEGWANQMRILDSQDLRDTIAPEEFEKVVVLLRKLDLYYKQAEQKFALISEKTKEGAPVVAVLRSKLRFAGGGYDDLKDFVDTLAAMNKALKAIAPPLPPYSRGSYRGSDDAGDPQSNVTYASDSSRQRQRERSESPRATPTAPETSEPTTQMTKPPVGPSVHGVYRVSLSALLTTSLRWRDPRLSTSAARLKLWGAGLFDGPIPIEDVFRSDPGSFSSLRQCVLHIFVIILVWEEQELKAAGNDISSSEHLHDQQSAKEITALLGTDEVIYIALECWQDIIDRHDDEGTETDARSPDDIVALVESLFDLLPSLRAARRIYALHKPTVPEEESDSQVNSRLTTATAAGAQSLSIKDVELNLDIMAKIIKKRDSDLARKDRNVRLYSPVFKKERERLQEFYAARNGRTAKVGSSKELEAKQQELVQTLSDFVAKAKEKPSMAKKLPTTLEKRRLNDMKVPLEDEDNESVNEIIDFLRDTTTVMWNISGAR